MFGLRWCARGTTRGLRRAGAAGSVCWPSLDARLLHESPLVRRHGRIRRCRPCRPAGGPSSSPRALPQT